MSDLRNALDRILVICNQARTYSRRTQVIHEVAMKGLGLTAGQREARHMRIFDRIGDEPGKQRWLEREAKRQARLEGGEQEQAA